ncbi:hypothetical protein VNO80_18485 [Phaseolus coccineus]|uniref:Uncharacterized protein n=1 Tax=Phaseolus coccineus TaxID=3886 RepID=A0AAN9MER8_PHACN
MNPGKEPIIFDGLVPHPPFCTNISSIEEIKNVLKHAFFAQFFSYMRFTVRFPFHQPIYDPEPFSGCTKQPRGLPRGQPFGNGYFKGPKEHLWSPWNLFVDPITRAMGMCTFTLI